LVEPNGLGVRVDSGYAQGDEIPAAYDSLIAKLITWGNDREEARSRMLRALEEMTVEGVATTTAAHELLLTSDEFVAGMHTTRTVESGDILAALTSDVVDEGEDAEDVLLVAGRPVRLWNPAMSASASAAVHGVAAGGDIVAPMQGTILKVLVAEGAEVEAGQALMVLEAMKMETTIAAPSPGKVSRIEVGAGDSVAAGQSLAIVE
jgi:acetyl-CoA/propionyl-CoA carboxylase biotin carboxyl carrier protein